LYTATIRPLQRVRESGALARLRAIVVLTVVVGALAWGADAVVTRLTTNWVEEDAVQRAELAVTSANAALARRWTLRPAELRAVLLDIARADQVLAVAACGSAPQPIAASERYPETLNCRRVRARVATVRPGTGTARSHVDWMDGVPVSAIDITGDTSVVGQLVLIHDMRLANLRVAQIRIMFLGAFAVFGVASLVFGFFSRRLLSQSWTREIRLVLGGFSTATEFRSLLTDVRSLTSRLTAASDARDEERLWTPSRLRSVVHDALDGARVVILANREPIIHQFDKSGVVRAMRPASGLVSALEPVIRACSGTWVAHGSGSADRDYADKHGRLRVPPDDDAYWLRRVWLTEEEERGYYYGFSNEGLWPLCHYAHQRPTFRSEDFDQYRAVNRRFVDAVCDEVGMTGGADPIILVQDYHFALAPRMLRERLPNATIVVFWHVPWPHAERIGICPWRAELLHGLLGASIIGFHTQLHCNNFIDSVDAFMEARIDRERNAVVRHGRQSLIRPYPISVEWPQHWTLGAPAADECRRTISAKYGLGPDAIIGLGVDRLDYTKGIEERFLAVERLLELHPDLRGRFTFVQISAPSRTKIAEYQKLAASVVGQANRINERFGSGTYKPIVLLREHHDHDSIAEHYRAADLCYVSSVHDGMNLVAKEFVASRDDEQGVLLLSFFAGASRELTEALIVNPYDLDAAAAAMLQAIEMSGSEQRERMRAMRSQVRESNVFRWAGRLLSDAARERRRAQLADRLSNVPAIEGAI
jgi:trehalose 6-phosphate synthase